MYQPYFKVQTMNSTNNLKKTPFATTKSELVDMYLNQMPEKDILRQINFIIIDKRRLEPGATPRNSKVYHVEFKEFVETYGLPLGYDEPEWYKP
jgi:hypothetical protein